MAPGDASYSDAMADVELDKPLEEATEEPGIETKLAEVERAVAALRAAVSSGAA